MNMGRITGSGMDRICLLNSIVSLAEGDCSHGMGKVRGRLQSESAGGEP